MKWLIASDIHGRAKWCEKMLKALEDEGYDSGADSYLTKPFTAKLLGSRIRNLLMTSAVPYQEDGLYVSPRRQGAGLVSMERALQTTVLLTGK